MVSTPTPPRAPWVDQALVIGDSTISGRGLFAKEYIEAGRVVVRLGGVLVSTSELQDLILNSSEYVDTLTVSEDIHVVLPPGTKIHYGNHSCDPNLWHVGPYEIAARSPIEVGEEATIDYGSQTGAPGFSMACACGSQSCRGIVTSDDWKLGELQQLYAGHWVPTLQERIGRQT